MLNNNQVMLDHLKNIEFVASRYPSYLRNDLIQEGYLGLIKAMQNFNPNKNVKLITYAIYYIKDYIHRYYLKNRVMTVELLEEDAWEDIDYINEVFSSQVNNYLNTAIDTLNPREQDIIRSRYLQDEPTYLHVLGTKHNISEERTRQVEEQSLIKLRQVLDPKSPYENK